MSFKLFDSHLTAAEGEVTVRSYHCTRMAPILLFFGLSANGYITVTNKRVIHFNSGSSLGGFGGECKGYNEVPIADVSGFAVEKGTHFSLLYLLAAVFVAPIGAGIISAIGLCPFFLFLFSSGGTSNPLLLNLLIWIQFIVSTVPLVGSFYFSRDNILRLILVLGSVFMYVAMIAISIGNAIVASTHVKAWTPTGALSRQCIIFFACISACYVIVCLYWFIKRKYVNMAIWSKSAMNKPISFSGIFRVAQDGSSSQAGFTSLLSMFPAWIKAQKEAPTPDSEEMFKEIGAMITDLQVMGDHSIEKWKQITKTPDTKMAILSGEVVARSRRLVLRLATAAVVLVGVCLAADKGIDAYVLREQRIKEAIKDAQKEHEHYALMLKKESEKATLKGLITPENGQKLTSLLDKYGGEEWMNVRANLNEASACWQKGNNWTAWSNACSSAANGFPRAVRQMYAGIWLERAEIEVQKDNAAGILSFAKKALEEYPGHAKAEELGRLANAIDGYNKCLDTEVRRGRLTAGKEDSLVGQMDVYGGDKWTKVKASVNRAKSLRAPQTRSACVDAWLEAGKLLRIMLLERWEDALPLALKSENWQVLSALSEDILSVNPSHEQAKAMLNLVNMINQAEESKAQYNQSFASALERAAREGYVNWDDKNAFVQQLDWYGGENWKTVKEITEKAKILGEKKKAVECLAQWKSAVVNLPNAAATARAGFWLKKTENEIKDNNWPKVLAYAEKALKEQPGNIQAAQAKHLAECQGKIGVLEKSYESGLNQALLQEVAAGRLKTGDQAGLFAQLDQFGGESWKSVKENTVKGKTFAAQGKYEESFVAWSSANQKIASAIRCMRTELCLQTAEAEKQKGNWAKVYAVSEKALSEDPENEHAKKLKNEANMHSK
ncbi:MAG: hypothetical protein WAX69_22165 [Victivallales bacterium]